MNQDQVEGKWDQIRGRAKKAWGEFTDDDFNKIEGFPRRGKARNAAELNLATKLSNDVNGVKGVKNRMTI
jgi:uncharacterized protein YjbJ (UPF0337 family)